MIFLYHVHYLSALKNPRKGQITYGDCLYSVNREINDLESKEMMRKHLMSENGVNDIVICNFQLLKMEEEKNA